MAINKIAYSSLEENQENYLNILRLGHSVADTGWRTYADSAGTAPVDGIGGAANITWTQNTLSPLSGDTDLRMVKDAANRQGQGASIDFTVANRHLAKVLQISFDTELISGNYESPIITSTAGTYSISSTTCTVTAPHSFVQGQVVNMTFTSGTVPPNGTYVITSVTATTFVFTVASGSGTGNCSYIVPADLRISIIQDPAGTPVVIEPVNTGITLGITNQRIRHIASFQTHISITSYRLCVHVANASTVAYTVDFANFKVWEPTQSIGSVITDWQSYTPTINGITSSSSSFQWRRVGGSVEIFGSLTFSSSTSATFQLPLPSGLSINSSVIRKTLFGKLHLGKTSADGSNPQWFLIGNGGNSFLTLTLQSSNTASTLSDFPSNGTGAGSGDIFTMFANVPIAGWGSSVAMSSDSGDGRVVAAKYTNLTTGTVSTTIPIRWNTREYDTHNAVSVGTLNSSSDIWKFTAPISGYYSISGVASTSGSSTNLVLYKNETIINGLCYTQTAGNYDNFKSSIYLNAGEYISVRVASSSYTSAGGQYSSIQIERISAGSQVIATNETVACSYWAGAGVAAGTVPINFGSRLYDTHNAVITGVGTWRFTAPMAGKYLITGQLSFGVANIYAQVFRDNVLLIGNAGRDPGGNPTLLAQVDLLAGQYIDIRPSASATVGGNVNYSSTDASNIQISRIGI